MMIMRIIEKGFKDSRCFTSIMDFAVEYYIGKLMLVVAKYRPNVAAHLYFLEDRTKLLALIAVELEARNVSSAGAVQNHLNVLIKRGLTLAEAAVVEGCYNSWRTRIAEKLSCLP